MDNVKQYYQDSITHEIIDLLKDKLPKGWFKEYYDEDPLYIPPVNMPCIVVEKNSTEYLEGPTMMDREVHNFTIKIVLNKKDLVGKKSGQSHFLEQVAEGKDSDTGYTSDMSVLGILRRNYTLRTLANRQTASVEYGITPRPQDTISIEAHIAFSVERTVHVPNRM